MLFNINTLTWDKEILELFDIPEQMLPKPKPSSCIYGMTDRRFLEIRSDRRRGGRSAGRSFRQTCFEPGDAKTHTAQAAFLLMNTGDRPVFSKSGL